MKKEIYICDLCKKEVDKIYNVAIPRLENDDLNIKDKRGNIIVKYISNEKKIKILHRELCRECLYFTTLYPIFSCAEGTDVKNIRIEED